MLAWHMRGSWYNGGIRRGAGLVLGSSSVPPVDPDDQSIRTRTQKTFAPPSVSLDSNLTLEGGTRVNRLDPGSNWCRIIVKPAEQTWFSVPNRKESRIMRVIISNRRCSMN